MKIFTNKKICKFCQYWRLAGKGDDDIPGNGLWCSNMQSPANRTRRKWDDRCTKFTPIGKKAPWWLRLAVFIVRNFADLMKKWNSKRRP